MQRLFCASLLIGTMSGQALACSYIPDDRSWDARIADEPKIFVGKVIAILDPEDMEAMGLGPCGTEEATLGPPEGPCVVFRVEQELRGVEGRLFEVAQGYSADCATPYIIGEWWLYAGNFLGGPSERLEGPLSGQRLREIRQILGG